MRRVYAAGPNNAPPEYVRMIYRGGQVTAEADSGGALTQSYSWGLAPDDLAAIHRHSDNLHLYVVQDQIHSVRGLVRRDGSATWQSYRRYGPYGAQQDSAGTDSVRLRYRWIGREFDPETGFYYIRARYYDPAAMRFTQEDPIGYAGGSNLFAYGDTNPTAGRDINGLDMDYDYYKYEVAARPDAWRGFDGFGGSRASDLIDFASNLAAAFFDEAAIRVWGANSAERLAAECKCVVMTAVYAHLMRQGRFLEVRPAGDWVQAGEIVGEVGETGLATGPHLHFETWLSGAMNTRAEDPNTVAARVGFGSPLGGPWRNCTGRCFGEEFHPILRQNRMHYGVDLGGLNNLGDPVYAVMGGQVAFNGRMGGYGYVMIIQTPLYNYP